MRFSGFLLFPNPSDDQCLRTGKGTGMLKCFVSKEMLLLLLMRIPAVLESSPDFIILQCLAY